MVWLNTLDGDDTVVCVQLHKYTATCQKTVWFMFKNSCPVMSHLQIILFRTGNSWFDYFTSLSDGISYKTVTFGGYEHIPGSQEKKPHYPIFCFLGLIYWSPTKQSMVCPHSHSTFCPCTHERRSSLIHQNTAWGQKDSRALLSEPLKPLYDLLYHHHFISSLETTVAL